MFLYCFTTLLALQFFLPSYCAASLEEFCFRNCFKFEMINYELSRELTVKFKIIILSYDMLALTNKDDRLFCLLKKPLP